MKKYSVIFFDLDNTLFDFYASEKNAVCEVLSMHNLPYDENTVRLYSEINRSYWEAFERGDIKREEIFEGRFKTLLQKIGKDGNTAEISKDYFGSLSKGHDLMEGAEEILVWLKNNGFKVYATTNGVAFTQYRRIEASGLGKYFDDIFISEEVGSQKPSKDYFEFVIKNIGNTSKDKILVVGDSMSSDILGGINSGLDTCWFTDKATEPTYPCTYKISTLSMLKNILK